MSLIDLVARTASREELVELLRGTEEQRQQTNRSLMGLANLVKLYTEDEALPTKRELRQHALDVLANK